MKHDFTQNIFNILNNSFGNHSKSIFKQSELLQYINQKTVSAHRGSKARGSFANLYAIYVLVEDYIKNGFNEKGNYSKYEGACFSNLFKRQRELPFGSKLQNHALNQRMNQEFKKFFPTCGYIPIIRDVETKRYWINENLIKIKIDKIVFNISAVIIEIINAYILSKKDAFDNFIGTCEKLKSINNRSSNEVTKFIIGLLDQNIDARIFEIVSYSILKVKYNNETVFFGFTKDSIEKESLKLYKTGRTNANDGGIDFVMKPLGRFFQVTETTDVKKYFLDIDKLEKFPITFVIKSDETSKKLFNKIKEGAKQQYSIEKVVENYMNCIEEIINIEYLKKSLQEIVEKNQINNVLKEIIKHSKVEFNYETDK